MTTLQKSILGIVALAIIILGGFALFHKKQTLGDATVSNYPTWYYNGIVIGSGNSLLTNLAFGSCTPAGATSLLANHQETLTCAAPKVKVGDKIVVNSESNGGSSTNGGFPVISSHVSSLGVISLDVVNLSGGTATPAVGPLDFASFR